MTDEQLANLRALAAAATTGPWTVEANEYTGNDWLVASVTVWVGHSIDGGTYYVTTDHVHASELTGDARTDAEFIAAARTALPDLLDALAAATQRAETAEREIACYSLLVEAANARAQEHAARCDELEATAAEYAAQMATTLRRAEAAEAKLAAVPVEQIGMLLADIMETGKHKADPVFMAVYEWQIAAMAEHLQQEAQP